MNHKFEKGSLYINDKKIGKIIEMNFEQDNLKTDKIKINSNNQIYTATFEITYIEKGFLNWIKRQCKRLRK